MARTVVTGATGFVGANLVRRLLAEGHEVHALVRHRHSDWRIRTVYDAIHVHEVNLGDADSLATLLKRVKPEWVFHLAAYGAYPSQTDLRTMVQTNVVGTLNVVQAAIAAGAEVIINTGSSSEYGFKSGPPDESEPPEPNSPYAVTKLSATLLCRELANTHHLPVRTLRLYSVYGPFEEPTRLVPALVIGGIQRRLPPLADPQTARDFVHVDDVVEAYMLVASTAHPEPGAVFNVGTGVQTPLVELVQLVRELFQISDEPHWNRYPDRRWDTHIWVADSRRIRKELGWTPRFSLVEGLQRTVAWFEACPEYYERYRAALSERST